MKLYRIWGILPPLLYNLIHTYDRLSDMFLAFIDLLLWGLTTPLHRLNGDSSNTVVLALLGVIILGFFPGVDNMRLRLVYSKIYGTGT